MKTPSVPLTRLPASRRSHLAAAVFAATAIAFTVGCATPGPDDYRASETRVEQSVAYGVVESVRTVRIGEDHAPVGTIAGAVIGGLLGNTIGEGGGRAAATVAGAVVGGIGGNALEHHIAEKDGQEIVVRLRDGRTIAITQDGQGFAAGERVRVLTGPNGSRVEHA